MNRRGFLSSCLALGAAPAIVRADSLMRVVPLDTSIMTVTYPWWRRPDVAVVDSLTTDELAAFATNLMRYYDEKNHAMESAIIRGLDELRFD